MVEVRPGTLIYLPEPPRKTPQWIQDYMQNPHFATIPPEILAERELRRRPMVHVTPTAGKIYGNEPSNSIYVEKDTQIPETKIIPVYLKAVTNEGNPIAGLSFSSSGVIGGARTPAGELISTDARGGASFNVYEGVPLSGGTGATGWEITRHGRKWRKDLVPTSINALPNEPITIIFRPEQGVAEVKLGLH